MKAYLIDPVAQTVTEVDYTGHYQNIYTHIQADMFETCKIEKKDMIFVDEEGLLKLKPDSKFFYYKGAHQPFVGRGLVLGTSKMGGSIEPKNTLDEIKSRVSFMTLQQAQAFNRQ